VNVVPDALPRQQVDETPARDPNDEEDIYDALHMEPLVTMVHISDDMVDKLQDGCTEDTYLLSKFSELKRQFAKAETLPVSYNNLMLEDAAITRAVSSVAETQLEKSSDTGQKYFMYLVEGEQTRLCIPRKLHKKFSELAHDRHNHTGIDRMYQRLRQHYYMRNMAKVVRDYIRHRPACLVNKSSMFAPSGKLIPIKAPCLPLELVTMGFVVKLRPSSPSGHIWR
jgi:hypothetical protein